MSLFRFHIALVLFFFGWSTPKTGVICESSYEIQVIHPGVDLTELLDKTLVRSNCEIGEPTSFYMDVESVVCGDSQCRIDVIRMYWDELGFYKHLVLPSDVELEKAEGASFSPADYLKLDSLLSDRNSSLKNVKKYEITGSETSEGVDALAGATIALDTKSYVKGAVWTCYTLWHWANGGAREAIRNITGDNMNASALRNYLNEEVLESKIFALEQLILRKDHDKKTIASVLKLASTNNYELRKKLVDYLEQLESEPYFDAMEQLLYMRKQELSMMALNSLRNTQKKWTVLYFGRLSGMLTEWDSYQQIDLFLSILKEKEIASLEVLGQVLKLLKHDNFLIARRAYWFLSNRELSDIDKDKLQAFHKKNLDRL